MYKMHYSRKTARVQPQAFGSGIIGKNDNNEVYMQ